MFRLYGLCACSDLPSEPSCASLSTLIKHSRIAKIEASSTKSDHSYTICVRLQSHDLLLADLHWQRKGIVIRVRQLRNSKETGWDQQTSRMSERLQFDSWKLEALTSGGKGVALGIVIVSMP